MSSVIFWREVILRVFILGAIAVRHGRYAYLPDLIQQTPYNDDYWKRHVYWARHALTMLARANLLKPKSLCEMARQLAEQLGIVEPIFRTDDQTKTYLAQFDFIQAITGADRNGDIYDTYPNYGIYYAHRVAELVRDLFNKGKARSALPVIDDSKLRDIIKRLDEYASKEFFFGGWDRFDWPDDVKKIIYD